MTGDNRRTPVYDADKLLRELRTAIEGERSNPGTGFARLDFERGHRTGTPEIILAEGKSQAEVIELVQRLLQQNGRALVSRASESLIDSLHSILGEFSIEHPARSSMVRITGRSPEQVATSGRVAIFTAGTSDLPKAEEVRMMAEEMGTEANVWADLGVSGLHRLIQPFREAIEWNSNVIVVVAGMDGALPSVIAGLSPVPVIGLPVSAGYGYGGNGEAALMAMLQSCSPGLTVVNIDNSVGAGVAAARIARHSTS